MIMTIILTCIETLVLRSKVQMDGFQDCSNYQVHNPHNLHRNHTLPMPRVSHFHKYAGELHKTKNWMLSQSLPISISMINILISIINIMIPFILTIFQACVPRFPVPVFKISIWAGGPSIWSRGIVPRWCFASIAHQAFSFATPGVCSCSVVAAISLIEVMPGTIVIYQVGSCFWSLTTSRGYAQSHEPRSLRLPPLFL